MAPTSGRSSDTDLEQRVSGLLADVQYEGHPLREALVDVVERMAQQVIRLERITQISDRYQSGVQERYQNLCRRYDRQLSRLEKAIRISDRYQVILHELNQTLQQASTHDGLTGLANRSLMAETCLREDERLSHDGGTYAFLAIDADHFKSVNDSYGHEMGDRVLIELARCFESSIREGDLCARWGGEEFLALLTGADLESAQIVANRLLAKVRALVIPHRLGDIRPRVSIGLAQYRQGESYLDVYRRADAALLLAKQAGRDRYLIADHDS